MDVTVSTLFRSLIYTSYLLWLEISSEETLDVIKKAQVAILYLEMPADTDSQNTL